jgi:hypothetical protein
MIGLFEEIDGRDSLIRWSREDAANAAIHPDSKVGESLG